MNNDSTEIIVDVEECYQLCLVLKLLYKKYPNKLKIFALPSHIKELFGVFLKYKHTSISNVIMHPHTVCCLTFHKNNLYSGSLWYCTRSYSNRGTSKLYGNGDDRVSCLTYYENKLYCGGRNLQLFRKDGSDTILWGHSGRVTCLSVHDNKLYSGSNDSTIRVWTTKGHQYCLATFIGHTERVRCITLSNNKLYSGSKDNTIRVWNTETYKEIAKIEYNESVSCLAIHEDKLFSGSDFERNRNINSIPRKFIRSNIRVWNTETKEEIATMRGHTSGVTCLTIHKNKLFSGSWDKSIRIWNIETYGVISVLLGHTSAVTCLTHDENKLYSGSCDKTIRVWNYNERERKSNKRKREINYKT
jgi:WD40 repeat protein